MMQRLETYVTTSGKRLRCGYTTGTCAAAAARAATDLLLAGEHVPAVIVSTPSGIDVTVEVESSERGDDWARCSVRKDAGDDPDVTDGVIVYAMVACCDEPGVHVEGGLGVGRVTRPGLDQPVGAAAINSVPRAMIVEAARESACLHGYEGGLAVEVAIPAGVELAAKTFNPRLGIVGGISVLGTSGIVRPMSEEALVSSIRLELRVLHEVESADVLVVPGNYGRDFAKGALGLSVDHAVTCSNYLGDTIDEAALLGFERMLLVGHAGKLVKVAGGVMNTHSRVADARMEVLAAHAALAGASPELVARIMASVTTDAAIDLLSEEGLLEVAMRTLMRRLAEHLSQRVSGRMQVEAVMFSNKHGLLGTTAGALALCERFRRHEEGV